MPDTRRASVSSRKEPRQARSAALIDSVLDAAVQVLTREGAARFTTARVAERAGVSVGSVYQYFPNKAAILFRLQTDEWRRTTALLRGILENTGRPPPARLRALVHAFLASECEEAKIRLALADAAPLYRDAPEAAEARASGAGILLAFLHEAAPGLPEPARAVAADIIGTTLSAAGKRVSEGPRAPDDVAAYAEALADMVCAYLTTLQSTSGRAGGGER